MDLQKRIEELEQKLGIGDYNPAYKGYFVLVKMLSQQNEFLDSFSIKTKITENPKEDATYARAKDMWENLPKMIQAVNSLRTELKIDDFEGEVVRQKPMSPENL